VITFKTGNRPEPGPFNLLKPRDRTSVVKLRVNSTRHDVVRPMSADRGSWYSCGWYNPISAHQTRQAICTHRLECSSWEWL
jgi:hypothetical protein